MIDPAEYRALFELSPLPSWVFDLETLAFLAVNDAAVARYGWTREEFLGGMRIVDIRPAAARPHLDGVLAEIRATGGPQRERARHHTRDGVPIEVECVGRSIAVAGRAARLVVAKDVTAEQRALEAEARFHAILERAPVGVAVSRDGRYLWANDALRRIFGHARGEDLIGADVLAHIAPAARAEMADRIARRGRGEPVTTSYQTLGRRLDGEIFPFHVDATVADFPDGPATIVFVADVSERVRGEEELRRSEQRTQLLARATNDAIYEWDLAAGAVRWSEGLCALFGYASTAAADELDWWEERIHPDDRARVAAGRRAALDDPAGIWSGEYRFLRAAGTYASVLDRGYVLRDESGRALRMIGGLTDLSPHRALEEQLRASQKMEAVGRLAGGIAHDFNNILTGIISYAELILAELPATLPLRDDVEQIRVAGERAANLTRQLLAFSRRQMLSPKPIRLNAVVTDLEKMLHRLIGEHIDLELDLAADAGTILADPGQLEQVLVNLAVNARDAMPDGGRLTIVTENVDLDAAAAARLQHVQPGPFVVLTVRDTGIGMDATVRAHLFEPFFTTKPAGLGTGLGLSTVYGIVKQSGGSIFVASAPERGATFAIYLPRIEAAAEPLRPARVSQPVRGEAETILLVEDDRLVRQLTREVLVRHGYQVLEAANGVEALRICEEAPAVIDLLLTDVVMPKMSGRQLVERLPASRAGLQVLFVSGYTEDELLQHGVLEDGTELLPKPFTPDALTRRIRTMLDRRRPGGGRSRAPAG